MDFDSGPGYCGFNIRLRLLYSTEIMVLYWDGRGGGGGINTALLILEILAANLGVISET